MTINTSESTFNIIRDDLAEGPKRVVKQSLEIGGEQHADIWLNDPAIAEVHAGIAKVKGRFSYVNVSATSATTLNGQAIPLNKAVELAQGDVFQMGPFRLTIEEAVELLTIRVVRQAAPSAAEREARPAADLAPQQLPLESRVAELSEEAEVLKQYWNNRKKEKAGSASALRPSKPPQHQKPRYYWRATFDLVRPWPFAICIWAFIGVGTLSGSAVFMYKSAFAPAPTSSPHTRTTLNLHPAVIATQPNGSACLSCHALGIRGTNKERMNASCAACHQAEGFAATITSAHREAGITCTTCHTEHRGEGFRSVEAALESCAKCHRDENKNPYNHKGVHTAHGGTFGYPKVNGKWISKCLDEKELEAKPELAARFQANKITSEQTGPDCAYRNGQFHTIHFDRVRVVPGIDGFKDPDTGDEVLSCSSCHKLSSSAANLDRTSPSMACAQCHNAQVFEKVSSTKGALTPSCTSCHVQHPKDIRWQLSMPLAQAKAAAPPESGK